MKIAIHHSPGTFSDRWIDYCVNQGINFKLVNCYASDIIEQIKDCNALMWHFHHANYRDALFAKQLLYAVSQSGKKTFPDFKTCWHFDDKVGQKYLLESIGAPLAPSYVCYSKEDALSLIENITYPKVFKLRSGAGSLNVKLVKSSSQARKLVRIAFGNGFPEFDRIENLKEYIRKYREGKSSIMGLFKGFGRLFIPTEFSKMHGNEKGYIYFQDFIPNNHYDIRIIVIDKKAFGAKRLVRKNDFRASGSGNLLYEKEHIPINAIKLAFQLTDKLQSQCAAFDFIYDSIGNPIVVELSYGFPTTTANFCIGYWDYSLQFHEEAYTPQYWMVEAMLK